MFRVLWVLLQTNCAPRFTCVMILILVNSDDEKPRGYSYVYEKVHTFNRISKDKDIPRVSCLFSFSFIIVQNNIKEIY